MKATTMNAKNMKATKTAKKPSRSSAQSPLDQRLLADALGGGALALVATPAEAAVISSGIKNISVLSLGGGSGAGTNQANGVQLYQSLNPSDPSSPQVYCGWGGAPIDGSSYPVALIVEGGSSSVSGVIATAAPVSPINFTDGQTIGPSTATKDWGGTSNVNKKTIFPNYALIGLFSFYASDNSYEVTPGQFGPYGTPVPQWGPGATGYAGFQFSDTNSDLHYGWMQVTVPTTAAPGQAFTLVQWAYESDANTAITITAASPVPEIDPASGGSALALLVGGLALVEQQVGFAAGAAGLRAWRKRRQVLSQS